MKKNFFLIFGLVFFYTQNHQAQSTFQQVYTIFQAKCSGCHNQTQNSGQLNLSAGLSATYNALVNKNPVNPSALSIGDKRVAPGDPHRSFLLRKINNGLDKDINLSQPSEGNVMPSPPNPSLSNYEIELISQWVLKGAPQTGMVVDTVLINEYYTKGGINSVPAPLSPPQPGTGFQVHLGKLFIPKGTETEFFLKYNPMLPDTLEVTKLELAQSPQSHHFVIYKFFPGQAANFAEGLRDTSKASHGSADAVSAFAPQQTVHTLPPGTAYFMEKSAIFDLNLHIVNTNTDSVLAAEIYFNMYTQPKGTAQKYMYRRNYPELGIVIPPGDTTSFTQIAYDSSETNMWQIWIMYTHTHRFGTDYDVWKRNADGTQGAQIYEGWYDWTYTFNQGYYGWGIHAPQEHFENPFLEINPWEGLIHKATFYNFGTDTSYFGLTSQDEMMVMGFEYTYGSPILSTGIEKNTKPSDVLVFPNPSDGNIIQLSFSNLNETLQNGYPVKLFDVLGRELFSKEIQIKENKSAISLSEIRPAPGIYFLKGIGEGFQFSKTLVIK